MPHATAKSSETNRSSVKIFGVPVFDALLIFILLGLIIYSWANIISRGQFRAAFAEGFLAERTSYAKSLNDESLYDAVMSMSPQLAACGKLEASSWFYEKPFAKPRVVPAPPGRQGHLAFDKCMKIQLKKIAPLLQPGAYEKMMAGLSPG